MKESLSDALEVAEAKETIYWAVQRFCYLSGQDDQLEDLGDIDRYRPSVADVRAAEETLGARGLLIDVLCDLAFGSK